MDDESVNLVDFKVGLLRQMHKCYNSSIIGFSVFSIFTHRNEKANGQ